MVDAARPRRAQLGNTPISRCEHEHVDWQTLVDHVSSDFSRLPARQVIQDIEFALQAVRVANLNVDMLVIAELIMRHRLLVRAGEIAEDARLDPEPHLRRRSTTSQQREPSRCVQPARSTA